MNKTTKLRAGIKSGLIPNELTTRTLNASRKGKGVKRFAGKKELYADLE
jgi:hypothetical protein